MAIVKVTPSKIDDIRKQVDKMADESANAKAQLTQVINGLEHNMELVSKRGIQERLNKLQSDLARQVVLAQTIRNGFAEATNNLIDVDNKYGNKSKSIFEKIKEFVQKTAEHIKDFFVRNKVIKYGVASGLFLTGSSILTLSAIHISLKTFFANFSWITGIFRWPSMTDVIDNTSDNDESNDGSNAVNNGNGSSTTTTSNTNIKVYTGSGKDYTPGAYSDYSVVEGLNTDFVVKQSRDNNCTSTADAIAGSTKKGYLPDPDSKAAWVDGKGATWIQTQSIPGTNRYTREQQFTEIYNQINAGNAVTIRVRRNSSDYGHSMVAVGLKNGCDPNNLTSADILIADPGTGKICTLAEYEAYSGGRTLYDRTGKDAETYSLRIAK